jgi:hypothetical protein
MICALETSLSTAERLAIRALRRLLRAWTPPKRF